MFKHTYIESSSNPRIKFIKKLDKSQERRESGLFVIEGMRECYLAWKSGIRFKEIYLRKSGFRRDETYNTMDILVDYEQQTFLLSDQAYAAVAYRENSEGILAVAYQPKPADPFELKSKPGLALVLCGVEKPGNIGAMFRTADAAGAGLVIFCDEKTDPYNANVVRASLGTIFTVPFVQCSVSELPKLIEFLGLKLVAAHPEGSAFYDEFDFTQSAAVLVGSEDEGVPGSILNVADARLKIPMEGVIDSLNVSVSAALMLYEANRQRRRAAK
jgi:TrmH family RNA methyltransferase